MSARDIPLMPRPPPKAYLLSLPTPTGRHASNTTISDLSISIKLLTILIRADAESWLQNDPDIFAWAHHLLVCPGSSENDRAFAQWVLDWGWKDGSGGSIFDQCRRKRGKDRSVGAPSFRGGRVVQSVQGDGMVLWFVQIFGGTRGKVEGFEKAVGMIRGV